MKLFLTLAVAGWEGYASAIRQQLGLLLRLVEGLHDRGWEVVNDPAAGVVCFADATGAVPDERLPDVAAHTVSSGQAWITFARVGDRTVLRGCITNHRTREEHVDGLLDVLDEARAAVSGAQAGSD